MADPAALLRIATAHYPQISAYATGFEPVLHQSVALDGAASFCLERGSGFPLHPCWLDLSGVCQFHHAQADISKYCALPTGKATVSADTDGRILLHVSAEFATIALPVGVGAGLDTGCLVLGDQSSLLPASTAPRDASPKSFVCGIEPHSPLLNAAWWRVHPRRPTHPE